MQFRKLQAADLKGPVDLPGFDEWLAEWGADDRTALILAPAGCGKGAAVGALAKRLDKHIVLCNLMELLDYEDPDRQLKSLLTACQTQRNAVVQLDKVSQAAQKWAEGDQHETDLGQAIAAWFQSARSALEQEDSVVVCVGRNEGPLDPALAAAADRKLIL